MCNWKAVSHFIFTGIEGMQAILQLGNLIKKNTSQTCKKKDTVITRRSYPIECFILHSFGCWPVSNQFQMQIKKCSARQDASVASANPDPTAVKRRVTSDFQKSPANVFNRNLEGSILEQKTSPVSQLRGRYSIRCLKLQAREQKRWSGISLCCS